MDISFINIIQIGCILFAAGVTIGNLRHRIGKLEKEQNTKYDALHNIITSRIIRVGGRIEKVETRIDKIETDITRHDELLDLHTKNINEIQKEKGTNSPSKTERL